MQSNSCGHQWIIRLTQQQSERALDAALIDILSQVFADNNFALYINKQFTSQGRIRCSYSGGSAAILNDEQAQQLVAKIDAERMRISGSQGQYVYFPIYHLGAVIGFVQSSSDFALTHDSPFVITNILNIYANQLYLLYRSRLDPLTELLNRQTFDSQVMDIINGDGFAERRDNELERQWYLAMFDIDHFKRVNDTYGHVIGDEVIILVARILKQSFRSEDYVFRYGGEEFAVLLLCDNKDQAMQVLERLRATVADFIFPQVKRLTISTGFCAFDDTSMVPELVHKADLALYNAKNNGRNQVVDFHSLNIPDNTKGAGDDDLDDDMLELF
ncbi:GGDEF domain-containing protein [Pseudoalteromonas ruthenica]|uniref:GGDEF domain-containing protein n=1 Tax=Pseudoalteromonas ruthenica TaxID=151081 RepID=UPI001485DF72|nr:GGDEF domain-containing protein [Pseudoalteromonas ruthenica]